MTANNTKVTSNEVNNTLKEKQEFNLTINGENIVTHDENFLKESFFKMINQGKNFNISQSKRKVYFLMSGDKAIKIESKELIESIKNSITN